jgi:hypothetical protein
MRRRFVATLVAVYWPVELYPNCQKIQNGSKREVKVLRSGVGENIKNVKFVTKYSTHILVLRIKYIVHIIVGLKVIEQLNIVRFVE